MGLFLSVLVASVGAMDLINCLAFVSNTLTAPPAVDADLERYRRLLKEQIESAPKSSAERLTYAQDGVLYKDGYRVEKFDDERLDQLNVKIKELERMSQEKEQKLDRLNVKIQELERKSVEREQIIEELRSRSVSRAASVEPSSSHLVGAVGGVPQIVLDDNDTRPESRKFRPIHREDEFRRTIKQRSLSSNVSEDRSEEIEMLTQMEEDEGNKMDDYMPLVYTREDHLDPGSIRHKISPIQELCHMHEDEDGHHIIERSPEPSFAADITRPWGDIKLEETKEKAIVHMSRHLSIEEEARDSDGCILDDNETLTKCLEDTNQWLQSPRNTFPELPQLKKENLLPTSESLPSNLSSHSNSPDPEHPTLKRTRKKSDLTALLLEEERKSGSAVVIQTEQSDSEDDNRTGFLQSKSPSPYIGAFVDNERMLSSGQLIPLVADLPKSPTPEQEPRSVSQEYQQLSASPLPATHSRDATISPTPVGSSGSPASPISSIIDESITDGPYQPDADKFSSSPVQSDRNVSREDSVSLASTDVSAASLDLHVDQALQQPTPPPPSPPPPPPPRSSPPIQHQAAPDDLDAGGVDRKSSRSPAIEGSKPTPPRRFRTRTRKVRSLTPIDFNQTFMDQFAEQRVSVSPSELEEYINSMDEIKIDPPKPVTPNYFIPTTPLTSGVPSLVVTDDKGSEARFHDSLSSKSFYGNGTTSPVRFLNHRVNYVEWIKKFPDNMTSHLELEDYDSDDEEVEQIIKNSKLETVTSSASGDEKLQSEDHIKFPVNLPAYVTPSPEPLKDLPVSLDVSPQKTPEPRTEFPLNTKPAYETPSPVSLISERSLTSESVPDSSSMAIGSPLLNSMPSPTSHFTPITSPVPSLNSYTPDPHSLSPRPPPKLLIPSRSPTASPIPPDMTPEDMVFEVGHLDGLIFETKSRSPTPLPQLTPLSPEELAYDIGNLGGLILGPPSRSVSPLPPSSSPTPGSSLSSPWTSLKAPSETSSSSDESARNTTTDTNNT